MSELPPSSSLGERGAQMASGKPAHFSAHAPSVLELDKSPEGSQLNFS